MKKISLLTFILFLLCANAWSQSYREDMYLLYNSDNSGIELTLSSDEYPETFTAETNEHGYAFFDDVPEGVPFQMKASKVGYHTRVYDTVYAESKNISSPTGSFIRYMIEIESNKPPYLLPDSIDCTSGVISEDIESGDFYICDTITIVDDINIAAGATIYLFDNALINIANNVKVNINGTAGDMVYFEDGDYVNTGQSRQYAFLLGENAELRGSHVDFDKVSVAESREESANGGKVSFSNSHFRNTEVIADLHDAQLIIDNSAIESAEYGLYCHEMDSILIQDNVWRDSRFGTFIRNDGYFTSSELENVEVAIMGNELYSSSLGSFDSLRSVLVNNNQFYSSSLGDFQGNGGSGSGRVTFTQNYIEDSPDLQVLGSRLVYSCNTVTSSLNYDFTESQLLMKNNNFKLTENSEITRNDALYGLMLNNFFDLGRNGLVLPGVPKTSAPVRVNYYLRVVRNTFTGGTISINGKEDGGGVQFYSNVINASIFTRNMHIIFNKNLIAKDVICFECDETILSPGAEPETDEDDNVIFNDPGLLTDSLPNLDSTSLAFQDAGPEDLTTYGVYSDYRPFEVDEDDPVHDTTHYSRLGVIWENTCIEDAFPPVIDDTDDDNTDTMSISGYISNMRNGILVAVNSTTGNTSITAANSDGTYLFNSLDAGDYMLQAIPNPNVEEGLLSTVYYDKHDFSDGHSLALSGDIHYADFSLLSTSSTTGSAAIKGRVVYEHAEDTDAGSAWEHDWFDHTVSTEDYLPSDQNPGQNVPLMMLDEFGDPVAYTVSNNEGYYAFDNIPEGNYTIQAVRYGYSLSYQEDIVLAEDEEMIVFAELTRGTVTSVYADEEMGESSVAYPNPFNNRLTIDHVKPGEQVSVMNVQGKVLFSTTAETSTVHMNTEQWPAGVYIVQLKEQSFKVVK